MRPRAKVSLLLTAYIGSRIWGIDWYQNEWPWPLLKGRIKVTSTIALHLTLNISEIVRDRGLVPKTTNRKWHMGYRMVTWPMTPHDIDRLNSWPQYAQSAISRKLFELETSNVVCGFVLGCRADAQIIFLDSGRGPGHVTPTIFGSTVGYPNDSLASCYPRDAMLARVFAIATCPSVCPSVCYEPVLYQNEES